MLPCGQKYAQEGEMRKLVQDDLRIYIIRQLVGNDPFRCAFQKRGDGTLRDMHCVVRSPDSDSHWHYLLAVWDLEIESDRQIPEIGRAHV